MTDRNLTCAELDERLGDYLEGALDDSSVANIEMHLSGCPACAALVRDFERITRQAAALPGLAPSRDLWAGIEARLDAPVIALSAHAADRSARHSARTAPTRWRHLRMGTLAAGLVGITAIGTYVVTSRSIAPAVAVAPITGADSAPSEGGAATAPLATGGPSIELPSSARPAAATAASRGATMVSRPSRVPAQATFDTEIAALRGVLTQRSEELDPRTVAILETSLATIDSAITEARQALQADPASRFLSTQLNKMLEKKLGVLRTAALLPSRT